MGASGNGSLNGKGMMPSLTVNNLQQSLDFFSGLGFEVEDRWEVDGKLLGAMLKAGNARLGLSQDDGKKGLNRAKGVGMRIYIEAADDIDQVAARAKASGITLTNPSTRDAGIDLGRVDSTGSLRLRLPNLALLPGAYHVHCTLTDSRLQHVYDRVHQAVAFDVLAGQPLEERGLVSLRPEWTRIS